VRVEVILATPTEATGAVLRPITFSLFAPLRFPALAALLLAAPVTIHVEHRQPSMLAEDLAARSGADPGARHGRARDRM
jgi:hypothetical protein